jgi:NADPH-dependent glutamate synthase beta subunit-like oxidoreductase
MNEHNEINVSKAELFQEILKMAKQNARFATATCIDRDENLIIIYHFEDAEHNLTNIRLTTGKGEEVPSISPVYLCAVLIENEIHDQFGVEFVGMAIDYSQKMLLTSDSPQKPLIKTYGEILKMAPRKKGRCMASCPAGINVPKYVRQISEGKYADALETIYQKNPIPAICGRVCFAPCEINCRQKMQGEPVMIRLLKRFVTDTVGIGVPKSIAPKTGKRVAIIGAGPAGLTGGFYLARKGYSVTIFDSFPEPGGMMRAGIPEFRLPRDILAKEIQVIKDQGVEIRCSTTIDNIENLMKRGYNAVLVATGAYKNMELGVPGENLPGVINCLTFLQDVNLGKKVNIGNKVLVVGGGNSAIDAARVALRTGSKEVIILYRRTRKEMPATDKEIEEALEEGIKLENLCTPTKAERVDDRLSVTCIRMKLGALDSSGRPRPEPIPGSEFTIEADALLPAIGQYAELPPAMGITLNKKGKIDEIKIPGVFAAGDLLIGPTSVVEAIRTGREAASAIDKYLGGDGVLVAVDEVSGSEFVPRSKQGEKQGKQVENPVLKPSERSDNYKEIEKGLTEELAKQEASRCWICDWTEH